MQLTSENVENIFKDCLPEEEGPPEERIVVEGILHTVHFLPEKLLEHQGSIGMMLMDLPSQFRLTEGGGWSFLNACQDKDDNQWTGLHQRMEQLFLLGMAVHFVKEVLPRELWRALPGGMPYYQVLDDAIQQHLPHHSANNTTKE